jgi:hypothetical protein
MPTAGRREVHHVRRSRQMADLCESLDARVIEYARHISRRDGALSLLARHGRVSVAQLCTL